MPINMAPLADYPWPQLLLSMSLHFKSGLASRSPCPQGDSGVQGATEMLRADQ